MASHTAPTLEEKVEGFTIKCKPSASHQLEDKENAFIIECKPLAQHQQQPEDKDFSFNLDVEYARRYDIRPHSLLTEEDPAGFTAQQMDWLIPDFGRRARPSPKPTSCQLPKIPPPPVVKY